MYELILGVPTLKRICPIELADRYFVQFFMRIPKINFLSGLDTSNRRTTSAHAAHIPARLQATWAELVRQLGVSNFETNYIFGILMKNCRKYQSAINIRDVAGTPNLYFT